MTEKLPEIEKMTGVRFSNQGRTVHLSVLMGGRLAEVTFASASLPDIGLQIEGAIAALRDAGIIPMPGKPQVEGVTVNTTRVRRGGIIGSKFVAMLVNEGHRTETMLVFNDFRALHTADALQLAVFDGMSVHDQKALLADVEKVTGRRSGLIVPSGKRPN